MNQIYNASHGKKTVHFMLPDGGWILFVSRQDMQDVLEDCCSPMTRRVRDEMLNLAIETFPEAQDRRAPAVDMETFNPVVNVFAMLNILQGLCELRPSDHPVMRANARKFLAVFDWFVDASITASVKLGLSSEEIRIFAQNRYDRINPPVIVTVTRKDVLWSAECDALCLAAEAQTFEKLTRRVWEIVPGLVEANSLKFDVATMRLCFQHTETANGALSQAGTSEKI